MRQTISMLAAGLAAMVAGFLAAPVAAEVTRANDISFVSRHEVVVQASPKAVWLALITPASWWRKEHTWSGDAKNLTLMPQAGGCFCETIPAVDEPGRFTLQGSVEHMRVVQAYPEAALRMVGSLGPLQSEPVTGVLTVVISKIPQGTRIVFEYHVGGAMRYEVPVISKAVDGVMGAQLEALAKPLGVVAIPAPRPPAPAPEALAPDAPAAVAPAPAPAAPVEGRVGAKPMPAPQPQAAPRPAPASAPAAKPVTPSPAPKPDPKPAAKPVSVDDAFGDLEDKPPR